MNAANSRTPAQRAVLAAVVFAAAALLLHGLWRGTQAASAASEPPAGHPQIYLSPVAMQLSPDGRWLYVVCQDGDRVLAVDTRTRQVVRQVRVGHRPGGIAVAADGRTLYVTSEWQDRVEVIDASSFTVRSSLATGAAPMGVALDRTGKTLYVANTLSDDVSILDLATGVERKRLQAGRFPEYVTASRDGRFVYVSNLLVRGPADQPPVSELTVLDAAQQTIAARVSIPGVIQMRTIAEMPASAGGALLIPFMRPKNLNPLVQIHQGWYLTHGMAVIEPPHAGANAAQNFRVAEVLLDGLNQSYADGFGAAVSPDGRWALVTASGADVVSVIDGAKLHSIVQKLPAAQLERTANRLDLSSQFVAQRLQTGRNPTAVVIAPDGKTAYIANRMDDTMSVLDLGSMQMSATIRLGGPENITRLRHGAQLFYSARYCQQGQMACATCHPHGGLSDGLAWSLETPQLGRDVVENKTLFGIDGTAPFKWNGKNPNLETQDGPRTAAYIFRSQGFSKGEVEDLAGFILSLRLPPGPHQPRDGRLTEAEQRGRAIFYRTHTNSGALIPPQKRCYFCHSPYTHYTSRVLKNVGTATQYDTIQAFDVPQLEGVAMKPPYLHNGEAQSLEEIWTLYNPHDEHGITSDMDKVQLNNLIEYLKTM
jgi:YVTN family beta-propeller protein